MPIPEKCKKCIYKIITYCQPNEAEISTIDVKLCNKKVSVYDAKLNERQLKRWSDNHPNF